MRAASVLFALIALRSAALADASVPPPSSALPVLTLERAVILDGPDQCNCLELGATHYFKPTLAEVRRIERWLPLALAEDAAQPGSNDAAKILRKVATDDRFYLGYVEKDGRRMISVHGFSPRGPQPPKSSSHCPCWGDGGGSNRWVMSFDLAAGTHGRVADDLLI